MNLSMRLHSLAATAVGIFGAVLLVGGLELGARIFLHFHKPKRNWGAVPLAESVTQYEASLRKPSSPPLHVPVRFPSPLPRPFVAESRAAALAERYSNDYQIQDSEVGVLPRPNSLGYMRQNYADGRTAIEALYTIDRAGRRFTPGQMAARPRGTLLFFGCSYVFGEGLNDHQTLPAYSAILQKNFRVYNYAFNGWGPNNVLRFLNSEKFGIDLARGQRLVAVYVFIDHHFMRALGSLNVYRNIAGWADRLPYYSLAPDGRLESRGMLSERPFLDPLFRLLGKSAIVRAFRVEIPPRLQDSHLRLVSAILGEIRDTLRARLGPVEFYVAIYPENTAGRALIPYLDERGLPSIDYSQMRIADYVANPWLPDGHPNAATNEFFARQLMSDLRLVP